MMAHYKQRLLSESSYTSGDGSLRNADLMSDSENISALATPSRTQRRMDPRRRRLKLFRKKTFLVNDANKSNENGTTLGSSDGNDNDNEKTSGGNGGKVRIVQFSEETALSRSIRRKTT